MTAKKKPPQKVSREEKRIRVLLAALPHVAFDGWTETALNAGAIDAGYTADDARRFFIDGPLDAIALFADWADAAMAVEMEKLDLENMRVRDRIKAGVQLRLEIVEPYKEAVRRGTTVLANPLNAAQACKHTYKTVDEIWYQAGDRSVDYNFYTKRGLLAGVYGSTVLYWLADTSENHAETWAFLDRRITDVLKVGPLQSKIKKTLGKLPNPFKLFGTPQNAARF